MTNALRTHPLTPERWADLERLFGDAGTVGGCWCMWWRLSGQEFDANTGQHNKAAFKHIVDSGDVPGLLAYDDERPIGWVSIAPRSAYVARFNSRSPVFKPLDDLPVWSILCFFVDTDYRGQQVASRLLHAAITYARAQDVEWLEAVPLETDALQKDNRVYMGTTAMFEQAGFAKIGFRRPDRPFMRLKLK